MPSRAHSPSRRDALQWLTAVGVGVTVGALGHGALYERHQVTVTRSNMRVPGLDPALDGLRVGLLTDVHHSAFVPTPLIGRAVTLLCGEQPDLIVLGGDYVTQRDRRFIAPAAEALAPLSAPHGVYAVLGNHDDDVAVPRALRRAGAEVLRDDRTRVGLRGTTLDLIGLRYWTRGTDALARLTRGTRPSTLLLAHDPRRIEEAQALGIPAVLSGHTHGGQIALPGVGWLATRKFPTGAGIVQARTTTLFVSRGVGTVYVPCRVNCPPEVAVLTLLAAPRADAGQPS